MLLATLEAAVASKSICFTMPWAPRALKTQALGTYSSTSNSQNENSLDLGLSAGFLIGVAGHPGGTHGFEKYWFYIALGTQSSQNTGFRYLFLNDPILRMRIH